MANIVELREMSDDKLEEMLENAREELFNLRFQQASARLEDYSRLGFVRREIAQLETVLHMRHLAIEVAADEPEIADALAEQDWQASARYSYVDLGWMVQFFDADGNELASALVDLNKAQPKGRKAQRKKEPPRLVTSYEIAG